MIGRVRYLCRLDERLAAAMMYGSLAQFEGDEFSDIEFILFFYDEVLSDVDQEEWVAQIAPVRMYFVNGFPCSKPLLWWTAPASCRVDWDPSSVRPWIAHARADQASMPPARQLVIALPATLRDRLDRRFAQAYGRRRG
jgi:hypothetical protein